MDAELKLYNSMFTGELTSSLEEQLVRIYSPLIRDESLVITAVSVQQQSGRTDCGFFTTAFALHTAMRNNFKIICFEQSPMRQHLLECLQNEALTEFPQSTSPSAKHRSKVSHIVINLFCTFKMPESFDSKMIECDRCAYWFHFKCVGLKKNCTGQLNLYKMFLVHLTL